MSQNNILTISSLKLLRPSKWKIVATVKNLSKIIGSSPGRYFYVDLYDTTGEIRAIACDPDIDQLYKKLEVNSVYLIESGIIQKEDKIRSHEFQIVFNDCIKQESNNNASVLVSEEENSSVASQSQNNALLEGSSQNSIAKEKMSQIYERLKEIKKEKLALDMEKLNLKYEKKMFIIKATLDLK